MFGSMDELEHPDEVTWDRIYIARRGTRRVANDDEVYGMLSARGFRRCYFEDYPVTAQWAITRSAEVVVGVHGAALSSLVFASAGVKVVELFNPGYSVDFFRRIVELVDGRWCGVYGRIPRDFVHRVEDGGEMRAFHYEPLDVSTATIERALAWLDVE
jgi:capsular polysaccharide biosynthesis protein